MDSSIKSCQQDLRLSHDIAHPKLYNIIAIYFTYTYISFLKILHIKPQQTLFCDTDTQDKKKCCF